MRAVHHFALIRSVLIYPALLPPLLRTDRLSCARRVIATEQGIEVPPEFGVAPSTLVHRKESDDSSGHKGSKL